MATNVRTDNKNLITQYCASTVTQTLDPVFLKSKRDPGVALHFNTSTKINNAAGTVFDHKTQLAHNESYLGAGKHAPVVIAGRNTGMVDGDTGFLSFMKTVFIEGRNAVMHGVDASVNAIWSLLPAAVKTTVENAGEIAAGLTVQDFADAEQEDAQALFDSLQSPDTLIALAQTAALMGLTTIPVVGQLGSSSEVANRIKSVIESTAGDSQEFTTMIERWCQSMSPAQMGQERQKLASFLTHVGACALLAALGETSVPLSKKTIGKDNSVEKHDAGAGPKARQTKCECAIGKPVIIATGEKTLSHVDFELPGLIPLTWSRKYRSGDIREGWFGQGWSSPWSVTLRVSPDALHYHDAEGREVDLPLIEIGAEHFDAYEGFSLIHPEPNIWQVLFKEGRIETFRRNADDHFTLPLTAVQDRNGNALNFVYPQLPDDPFDPWLPNAIHDSAGRTLMLSWNRAGRLIAVRWYPVPDHPIQTLASYDYSPAGDLVAHTDGAGAVRRYEWRKHLLVAYVEFNGMRYCAEYDHEIPSGRVVRSYAEADGRGLRFDYDDRARTTRITDSLGRTTHYEYNERHDIIATTGPDGQRVETPFDSNGNPRGTTDPLGRKTHYAFDRRGNLTNQVDPSGAQTKIAYNELDLAVCITDALGHCWQRDYDPQGKLLVSTDPLGHATHYNYDERGLPTTITDPRGGTKYLTWDRAGNLTAFTDCANLRTEYRYDSLGRLLMQRDALGQENHYEWDATGRLISQTDHHGARHAYQWSPEGLLLTYTAPLGQLTHWRYNAHGELIERIDANGNRLGYTYDAVGRLVRLCNENGVETHFTYDSVDRITDEIGFDGRHRRYTYNAAGELTHLIEAGGSELGPGKVSHFKRDALGRLIAKTTEGDSRCDASYRYDKLGRLISADNPAAKLAFAYDPAGQLISEKQTLEGGDSRTLTHAYDPLGNRVATRLPDQRTLHWLFYGTGHLHQITLEKQGDYQTLCAIERDALHREVKRTQGTLTSRYEYDPIGRLTRHWGVREHQPNSEAVIERGYHYDKTGNLLTREDRLRGETTYQYDLTGRIRVAKGLTKEFFEFDPAGNIQPPGLGSFPITGNRLSIYKALRYKYDSYGNVINRKKGRQEEAMLAWNAKHQLIQATVTRQGTTQTTQYEYDALGRRTRKHDAFGATEYLWDGDLMIESRRNNKQALFLFEPNSFVPLATIQDEEVYWYQCDQIGTPQELTDQEGNIVWAADYKVWGETILRKTGTDGPAKTSQQPEKPTSPVLNQPFRFQGQQFDEETGLHYNRHRYYDPGVGRYLSQDLIGLQGGSNLFTYVSNPTGWIDPFGLVKAGTSANAHRYDLNTAPDYGIEVNGIHTKRVIIDRQRNTMIRNIHNLPSPSKTLSDDLSNPEAANSSQEKLIGYDTETHSISRNSCLRHCAEVLQAGSS
jgi:RHS repeat-associated protein